MAKAKAKAKVKVERFCLSQLISFRRFEFPQRGNGIRVAFCVVWQRGRGQSITSTVQECVCVQLERDPEAKGYKRRCANA
jgi:hypothetical protein